MKEYELPISVNYVCNWDIKDAIRELLQNAVDSEKDGHKRDIYYDEKNLKMIIRNYGTELPISSLVLGNSSKQDIDTMIGKYGEGYKLALVVLLRNGINIEIYNNNYYWKPSFRYSETYDSEVLCITTSPNDITAGSLSFHLVGIDAETYEDIKLYFPCIENNYGEKIQTENGEILFDEKYKGKMYVEGIYIQEDNNFEYGYNFSAEVVQLDRDRKAINYYELRDLTAKSIVTAEGCNTKIFDAISKSYTDVRNIEKVIDEASPKFLAEYRDEFYKKNNLQSNTLVATSAVVNQLKKMDISLSIVEGSEITSYVIAKANDKLGLIKEAKSIISSRTKKEEIFDNFEDSSYLKLMRWLNNARIYLPQKEIEDFMDILYEELYDTNYYDIEKYIPEDFDYSEVSVEILREKYLEENDFI